MNEPNERPSADPLEPSVGTGIGCLLIAVGLVLLVNAPRTMVLIERVVDWMVSR